MTLGTIMRCKTRRQRYNEKKKIAKTFPISIATINFKCDGNLAYIVRTAACFGAENIHVIGSVPKRSGLSSSSGSLIDYANIQQYSSPRKFLSYMEENDIKLVSAELTDGSINLENYRFNFNKPVCVILGNEQTGVPVEILRNSDIVHIEMPGVGYCLNTSQAGNIMLYEAVKQYKHQKSIIF